MAAALSQDLRRRSMQTVEADSPAHKAGRRFAAGRVRRHQAGPVRADGRQHGPARIGGYGETPLLGKSVTPSTDGQMSLRM